VERDMPAKPLLVGDNARSDDVDQAWEQDNQAWWDWYVSLADNDSASARAIADSSPRAEVELPLRATPVPLSALLEELSAPYALSSSVIESFRANGFVKLKDVLSAGAVAHLRGVMKELLQQAFEVRLDGGVRNRFLSLEMIWLRNACVRAFVLSPRVAQIAARLLGVPAVRLYHDNLLSKEPGCGRTPWHYDDHHFPLATHDVVTAWLPAQPIPRAMGPLAFAWPINSWKLVRQVPFNKFDTSYDRTVGELFRRHQVAIEDGPFDLGEVSFHHNLSFHTAEANRTDHSRLVLATTYYADGARLVERPTMVSGDWQKFIPDTAPGEVAASRLNPICWPVTDASLASAEWAE
jgi:ectoine hydroxylase-related dioxygenase (phytanoyl-CoA dioxygenase family)